MTDNGAGSLGDATLYVGRGLVEDPTGLPVGKDRDGVLTDDAQNRPDVRGGSRDNLVAGIRIYRAHRRMKRPRAGVGGHCVLDAVAACEAVFELPHLVMRVPLRGRLVDHLHELLSLGVAEEVAG